MDMNQVYQLMRLNRAIKDHRIKFAGVLLLNILRSRHLAVRFDPIMACNLSCRMCHFSNDEFRKTRKKGGFNSNEIDRLAKMFFPRTLQVVFGCKAEPTLYKDFPDLVKIAKSYGVPYVGLVSNGQLITEEHIKQLVNYGLNETYNEFSKKIGFNKSLIRAIFTSRDDLIKNSPFKRRLTLSYDVM